MNKQANNWGVMPPQYEQREGEYFDGEKWICPNCHTPVSQSGERIGTMRCPCECSQRAAEQEHEKEKQAALQKRRVEAFDGNERSIRLGFTFAVDDERNQQATEILRRYCAEFEQRRKKGEGFLIHSPTTGGGKSFLAAAVANDLIDRGYTVLVTNFFALGDKLRDPQAYKFVNQHDFIRRLRYYDLIVIDDLGANPDTTFTHSIEYRIIEDLTDSQVPLIFTTNATLDEIMRNTDAQKKRIFDRILGKCALLHVGQPNGRSRRVEACERLTKGM